MEMVYIVKTEVIVGLESNDHYQLYFLTQIWISSHTLIPTITAVGPSI